MCACFGGAGGHIGSAESRMHVWWVGGWMDACPSARIKTRRCEADLGSISTALADAIVQLSIQDRYLACGTCNEAVNFSGQDPKAIEAGCWMCVCMYHNESASAHSTKLLSIARPISMSLVASIAIEKMQPCWREERERACIVIITVTIVNILVFSANALRLW